MTNDEKVRDIKISVKSIEAKNCATSHSVNSVNNWNICDFKNGNKISEVVVTTKVMEIIIENKH